MMFDFNRVKSKVCLLFSLISAILLADEPAESDESTNSLYGPVLTFDANGGIVDPEAVAYYDEYDFLPVVYRLGYTFREWVSYHRIETKTLTGYETTTITSGGTTEQTVTPIFQTTITEWSDGIRVKLGDPVNPNVTLVKAMWLPNSYVVKFDANGGVGTMSDQQFYYGEAKSLRGCDFTMDGKVFVGWKRPGGGECYSDRAVVSNMTEEADDAVRLVAQWADSDKVFCAISPNETFALDDVLNAIRLTSEVDLLTNDRKMEFLEKAVLTVRRCPSSAGQLGGVLDEIDVGTLPDVTVSNIVWRLIDMSSDVPGVLEALPIILKQTPLVFTDEEQSEMIRRAWAAVEVDGTMLPAWTELAVALGCCMSDSEKQDYYAKGKMVIEKCPKALPYFSEFACTLGAAISVEDKHDLAELCIQIAERSSNVEYGQPFRDCVAKDGVEVSLTVTNVVVQYVLNSIQSEIAVPVSNSVGFVNIITEVASSGAVSVPTEWRDNYQQFETKFGTDFGKALAMKTGKKDGAGNDMFVWQDFVAGTDPTDENDKFTASITIVAGVPVISYTPELTAEQAALRVYKTYGKMKLTDTAWTDITAKTSEERANYNFFKVSVEMK